MEIPHTVHYLKKLRISGQSIIRIDYIICPQRSNSYTILEGFNCKRWTQSGLIMMSEKSMPQRRTTFWKPLRWIIRLFIHQNSSFKMCSMSSAFSTKRWSLPFVCETRRQPPISFSKSLNGGKLSMSPPRVKMAEWEIHTELFKVRAPILFNLSWISSKRQSRVSYDRLLLTVTVFD